MIRPLAVAVALLLAAPGCHTLDPVAYAPDPAVVRAIPPSKARETVKRVIERAREHVQGWVFTRNVEVDEDGIRFEACKTFSPSEDYGAVVYEYAALAPHLYTQHGEYAVCLDGPIRGSAELDGIGFWKQGLLWFPLRRDAELLIDGATALKASGAR